ncbi:hypothetical protein B566_EDAN008640 [Ephemera danica]|nr:hypothetical protein B566_EDAN008640 [Ephemera danica]
MAYVRELARRGMNVVLISRSKDKLEAAARDIVNNVGVLVPYPMFTDEMSEELIWDHLMVNVAAATLMTSLVLPSMKAMKRGAIIYIDYLSYILQLECEGSGVSVQLLTPGYVITKMVGYSSTLMSGGLTVPSAERYARHAMWFAHVAPVWVVTAVMRNLNKKFRKEYEMLQSAKAKKSN